MYEYQYSASKFYKLFIISSLLYFYNVLLYQLFNRRHVGMADEADSKSVVGNYVWVQVPLPALSQALRDQGFFYAIRNHFAMFLLRKKRSPRMGF